MSAGNQRVVHEVLDGFGCDVGRSVNGWFAGIQVRPDRDLKYRAEKLEFARGETDSLLEGITPEDWAEGLSGTASQSILLLEKTGDGIRERRVVEGRCFSGPAVPKEVVGEPAISWTERETPGWCLKLFSHGKFLTIHNSTSTLRSPAIAQLGKEIYVGCEEMGSHGPEVLVLRPSGEVVHRSPGTRPSLAFLGDEPYLLCEHPHRNGCRLSLTGGLSRGDSSTHTLTGGDDLNINATMRATPGDESLLVVHEACGMWGYDEQLGRHRDLCLWQFHPEPGEFLPAGSTANGRMPVPRSSYIDRFEKNSPPIRPLLGFHGGDPVVIFRRFRFRGRRSYGWDVHQMRLTRDGWQKPRRISRSHGYPDTCYGVLLDESPPLLFNSCFDQLPRKTWTRSWKTSPMRPLGRPYGTRLEVQEWNFYEEMPDVSVLDRMQARYGVSPPVRDIALPAPPLGAPSAPGFLLWADMHVHTAYSKCVASMDGTIDENLLYQREALGCEILCLTEHTHLMNDAEFSYMCDCLEMAGSGGSMALYGTESQITGQDTIYYTMDRGVFERLRVIAQLHSRRSELYSQIRKHFAPGQVLVVRHFDSAYKDQDPDSWPESFDPELEVLMEAMQYRGNSLIGKLMADDGRTPMPGVSATRFLNAGKRVGLVGGSDHNGGRGPNHVCLTGIWAREPTPEGVWDALRNRRTIATSNGKVALWAECNGVPMGGEVEVTGEVRVRAWASSANPVRRAALLRNGDLLGWHDFDGKTGVIDLVDLPEKPGDYWYSVTVETDSQFFFQPVLCHSSPFFVSVQF